MQEEFWIRFIQVTLKVRSWSQLRLWVGISQFGEIQLCQSFHIHRHGDVHRVHRRFDLNALKRYRWSTQPPCRCTRPRWSPGKDQPQEIGKVFTAKPSTVTKTVLSTWNVKSRPEYTEPTSGGATTSLFPPSLHWSGATHLTWFSKTCQASQPEPIDIL